MSHNPNTVKSQDDLNPCNDGKRSSDVLLSTIEELEKTKKQLEIAKEALDYYSDMRKYNKSGWCSTDVGYKKAWEANLKIEDLNK